MKYDFTEQLRALSVEKTRERLKVAFSNIEEVGVVSSSLSGNTNKNVGSLVDDKDVPF